MTSIIAYTDLTTVKQQIDKTTTEMDAVITRVISAISRVIDNKCNRKQDGFVAAALATARVFPGSGSGVFPIPEAALITSVGVKASATDATYTAWDAAEWLAFGGSLEMPDYNSTPYIGLLAAPGTSFIFTGSGGGDEQAWPSGRGGFSSLRRRGVVYPTVQITARWGYALTVPPEIEQACVIESARLFKIGQSGYADTLASMELGQLIQMAKLHPTTLEILNGGRYVRAAV